MRKLTIQDCQKAAAKHGGFCISKEYIGLHYIYTWKCSKGHIWKNSFSHIRHRHKWCNICKGYINHSLEYCHILATKNQGKCLSKEFINYTSLLEWECHLGHKWKATSKNVKQGSWCHECAHPILTIEDCHKAAFKFQGKFLDSEYINTNTEYLWECKEGHRWKVSLNSVRNCNVWCYKCSCFKNKKLTIEDCHKADKLFKGKCLSKFYVNNCEEMLWKCEFEHIFKSSLYRIKSTKKRCTVCIYSKNNIEYCHKLAKEKGGYCLSNKYITNLTKYKWKCKEGHEWKMPLKSCKRGVWCYKCSYRKYSIPINKLSIEDCNIAAAKRNGKCLSVTYVTCDTKYKWQCEVGHIWKTSLSMVKSGTWCKYCCSNAKWTIERCQSLALSVNFKCLSKEIINTYTKMRWECDKGHIFMVTPSTFKKSKICRICQYPNLDKAKQLALKKSGQCISEKFIKNKAKLIWKCKSDHIFKMSYNSVSNGRWCPLCSKKESKAQKLIYKILTEKYPNYNIKYNYKGFDWLKGQELDIYIPELKLAIEYDGRQHFMPVRFGGISIERAKKNFTNQQNRDLIKNAKVLKNNQDIKHFIRFNYKERLTENYVLDKLNQ